jgi:hypothetical protein
VRTPWPSGAHLGRAERSRTEASGRTRVPWSPHGRAGSTCGGRIAGRAQRRKGHRRNGEHDLGGLNLGGNAAGTFALAPRGFTTLDGKVVGLLDSTKRNSDRFLDGLAGLLQERHALEGLVREQKPYFGNPVPDEQAASLAARCDVVITGVGD